LFVGIEIGYISFMADRFGEFERGRKWIDLKIEERVETPEGLDRAYELIDDLKEDYADFDRCDLTGEMKNHRDKFDRLPDGDRKVIERAIVYWVRSGNEEALSALRFLGRETDMTLVGELEEKYGVELEGLKVMIELFSLTYGMWKLNRLLEEVDKEFGLSHVRRELSAVLVAAEFLSSYRLVATHATNPWSTSEIYRNRVLIKSESGEKSHYEGDGVYFGIFGSYREWSDGGLFEINLPMADTLPILVGFNGPRAMLVALGECVDIREKDGMDAVVHGLVQWRQCEYNGDSVNPWKLKMLSEFLKSEVVLVKDEDGLDCVVVDSAKDPIIWAVLARSLRIRRLIPMSEVDKTNLPSDSLARLGVVKETDRIPDDFVDDKYEGMAGGVRRIKGVVGR
jgi:hypothetical protein